jgi:hypothetical protein
MFNLAKDIRDLDLDELSTVLADRVADIAETFEGVDRFGLTQMNRSRVKYLLARMTAWVDEQCGEGPGFPTYYDNAIGKAFEIEHIWANKPERHLDEFPAVHEFEDQRNRLGGLVLLPKDFNASYGDKPYEVKLDHYFAHNLLVRSLHPRTYEHNPTFRRFVEESGLPFRPHPAFTKADQEERQALYRQICEQIWDPDELGLGGGAPTITDSKGKKQPYFGVAISDLIDAGYLTVGETLAGRSRGDVFSVSVLEGGRLATPDGSTFESPSGAAMHVLDRTSWNGWDWWEIERNGTRHKLSRVRELFLAERSGKI